MKEARTFFNLPETIKQKYSSRPQYIDEYGGWVRLEQEKYVEFVEVEMVSDWTGLSRK